MTAAARAGTQAPKRRYGVPPVTIGTAYTSEVAVPVGRHEQHEALLAPGGLDVVMLEHRTMVQRVAEV